MASDLPVLISYSNSGYIEFAINMLYNLSKHAPNHKVHFYCLDSEIYESLRTCKFGSLNLTLELWNCSVSKYFEGYYSTNYPPITQQKVKIIKDALSKYEFIHFIDCDVVCIEEPTADFYKEYISYDIVFQFDTGIPTGATDDSYLFHPWTCTGNMSLRRTPGTTYILNAIEKFQTLYPESNDQEALFKYFERFEIKDIRQELNARLYVYPLNRYMNGHIFKSGNYVTDGIYFLHANHTIGNEPKRDMLKRAGTWFSDLAASKVESS